MKTLRIVLMVLVLSSLSCAHSAPLPPPTTNSPVTLGWTDTGSTPATGYELWSLPGTVFQPASTNWTMTATAPVVAGQTAYQVTVAALPTPATFIVVATNSIVTGAWAAPVTVTPPTIIPAVTGLQTK